MKAFLFFYIHLYFKDMNLWNDFLKAMYLIYVPNVCNPSSFNPLSYMASLPQNRESFIHHSVICQCQQYHLTNMENYFKVLSLNY